MKKWALSILSLFILTHCGNSGPSTEINEVGAANQNATVNPFDSIKNGANFEWGKFIHAPYQSRSIEELPIPIYLAFFTPAEEQEVIAGIEMANSAIGYDLFEVTDRWDAFVRVIYKVDEIDFRGDQNFTEDNPDRVIGYTYTRSIHLNHDMNNADRIVTDWAMEIKEGFVTHLVIAHELGHAMGITDHKLIDYDHDKLVTLEKNSLMDSILHTQPTLDDYNLMMQKQGELLVEYLSH